MAVVSFESALSQAARGHVSGELVVERGGFVPRVLNLSFRPLRVEEQSTIAVVALDVTELRQTRKTLEPEKSLQVLSSRILRLQDEERRRIARDLHDVSSSPMITSGCAKV